VAAAEYQVQQVVLTDTDTVWLRNPLPYLERHPSALVFTTTDCNSHEADTYFTPGVHRCA
jgi:Nucleotide-diphospho-sugar transferase